MKKKPIKYTVRDVGANVDFRLREEATHYDASLNQTILRVLDRGLGLGGSPVKRRNLSAIAGALSPSKFSALEAICNEQRRIDLQDWA